MSTSVVLAKQAYGKDKVRILKVIRDPASKTQTVVEMTVRCLIDGDFETSYTKADNSLVVTTDTVKNTVYILAKQNPVTPPELFAATLATHFVKKYDHVDSAYIDIKVHRWSRISIDGTPHPHSFWRDGDDLRLAHATFDKNGLFVKGSITGLLVLKSTGSQFHSFFRDDYTTLQDTYDRIFSTEVECNWKFSLFKDLEDLKSKVDIFEKAYEGARSTTLKIFAEDDSASVQATLYKMCEKILTDHSALTEIDYALPNKHYWTFDLSPFGLKNEGADAEIYRPWADPSGFITATVKRKGPVESVTEAIKKTVV